MLATAQFDPTSLAIWTAAAVLPQPLAQLASSAMGEAIEGRNPLGVVSELPADSPRRRRILWLASSIWHEKRHFFDICLTTYGARRFRELFVLASNFYPLLADVSRRGEPVWFPVEIYQSALARQVYSIGVPSPDIVEMARRAGAMKRVGAVLDQPLQIQGYTLHLGGDAQLEGLAQVSQMHAIEDKYGIDELVQLSREHVHGRLTSESGYRMIETVAGVLGCQKELSTGAIAVSSSLAAALFIVALNGKFQFRGEAPTEADVSPRHRLLRLMEYLGPQPGTFHMTDEEAWDIASKAAARLWRISPEDAIEADIDAMEAITSRINQPWHKKEKLDQVWSDFIRLRRELLAEVRVAGPAALLPRRFPRQWMDRLSPWHVVATPSGTEPTGPWTMIQSVQLQTPQELAKFVAPVTCWARLASGSSTPQTFGPTNRSAWLEMLRHHGPRARLMLNGRRHRLMVPPELERVLATVVQTGVDVRFVPGFEWPSDRDAQTRKNDAVAMALASERSTLDCDVTGRTMAPTDAAVLTPWEFRRSHLAKTITSRPGAEGVLNKIRLKLDWSDWVVAASLLQDPKTGQQSAAVL